MQNAGALEDRMLIRELYGLYEARQASRTLTRLMIVEGYMDVVRLHQAGINYAVATLGTATTPEHLSRVFRICQEVIYCFDGDRAGKAAAWRALENSLAHVRDGRQIRFLFLPDGHDGYLPRTTTVSLADRPPMNTLR